MAVSRRAFIRSAAVLASGPVVVSVLAQAPPAAGEPAVRVTGRIAGGERWLTIDMLEKLPQHSFSTNSPWHRQPQTYAGPLLRDVLAQLGANGSQLRVTALNDYAVTVPVDDARRIDMIVAHRIDGKRTTVRDRGPMMFMYPFDSRRELQAQRCYERAIWQIKSIEVE